MDRPTRILAAPRCLPIRSYQAMYAPNSSLLAANPFIGGLFPQEPLIFGKASARTSGFGAFGGYNSQWEDVVIGVEASYLHGGFGGAISGDPKKSLRRPCSLRSCLQDGSSGQRYVDINSCDFDSKHGDVPWSRRLHLRILPTIYVRWLRTRQCRYHADRKHCGQDDA